MEPNKIKEELDMQDKMVIAGLNAVAEMAVLAELNRITYTGVTPTEMEFTTRLDALYGRLNRYLNDSFSLGIKKCEELVGKIVKDRNIENSINNPQVAKK